MKRFFILIALFSIVPRLHAQDLNRLRDRSTALWKVRVQGDRAKALQFVLPAMRSNYSMGETVREAKIVGFEFGETLSKVTVSVRYKVVDLPPPFDSLERSLREVWEWTNGNWFLSVPEPSPFGNSSKAPPPSTSFKFDLVEDQVNLGQHKQGDRVTGTLHFKATRAQVRSVRSRGVAGWSIQQPVWDPDNEGGRIDFALDTTLLSAKGQFTAVIDAVGPAIGMTYPTSEDTLRVEIDIRGQIRIQQVPDTIDPKQAGRAELEVQNVSDKPFSIKGIQSTGEVFKIDGDVPPTLQPGQTIKLAILYGAHVEPVGGEVLFFLSPGVLPGDSLVFPIGVRVPAPPPPVDLRQQLDEILRQRQNR